MRVVPRSPNGLKMINQENHSSGGHPKCLPAYCRRQVDRVSRPDHVASRKNELNSSTLELGPSHCRESMRRLRVSLTIKGNRAIPITLPKNTLTLRAELLTFGSGFYYSGVGGTLGEKVLLYCAADFHPLLSTTWGTPPLVEGQTGLSTAL